MTVAAARAGAERVAPASARWALGLCTVVCWFFITAAGFATGPLQALPWLFVPGMVPNPLLIAVLGVFAVLGFLASLLPLGPRWSREELAARTAVGTIAAGALVHLLTASPLGRDGGTGVVILMMVAAFAATAGGALFLNAVIGLVNRRAVAGGLVGAVLLRQLILLLPGRDARDAWDVVAAIIVIAVAILGAWFAARWRRTPVEDRGESFERRAGGLRLRGAIALGVLLFFELTYGLPGLVSVDRSGAVSAERAFIGALRLFPLAIAWLFVVRGLPVARHRFIAVTLSLILTFGAVYPFLGSYDYSVGAIAAVLAQCAAFVLIGRALAPASGRRSGRKLATGLALFLLLTIAHAATLVTTQDPAPLEEGRFASTVIAVVAGVVLAVAMYLTPRPVPAAQPLPDRWLYAAAAAVPVLGFLAGLV